MKPGISVCFVVKNGLVNGYPFWESLNSSVAFADEIVISEGYSRDNTYEALVKFKERHGPKVKLFRTNWDRFNSPYGEVISDVSHEAIGKCIYDWIYYLQADEIVHEGNYKFIREVAQGKYPDFKAVSFPFKHCMGSWNPYPAHPLVYQEAMRMVKRLPSIRLLGDAWNFTGDVSPCYPAGAVPKPIFHLAWVFPKNIDQKNIEQSKIYSQMSQYRDKADASRLKIEQGYEKTVGFDPPTDLSQFPIGIERLFGKFEYSLPDGVL